VLPALIDKNNTASEVWADTAYRSQANEKYLADRLLRSQIHRKKPKGSKRSVKTPGQAAAREASIGCQFHGSSLATWRAG
jgi:transposase, IS5 family